MILLIRLMLAMTRDADKAQKGPPFKHCNSSHDSKKGCLAPQPGCQPSTNQAVPRLPRTQAWHPKQRRPHWRHGAHGFAKKTVINMLEIGAENPSPLNALYNVSETSRGSAESGHPRSFMVARPETNVSCSYE